MAGKNITNGSAGQILLSPFCTKKAAIKICSVNRALGNRDKRMWPFKRKQQEFPDLKEELLALCREWFQNHMLFLPEDELPSKEEIEADIIQMRDEIFNRVISSVPSDSFLKQSNMPDDEKNQRTLSKLVDAYAGHESTTPIFTKIALSKTGESRYQSGWALCTLRLIAETYLEQSVA